MGWSTGGNYRYYALSADTRVKDALLESPVPGKVQVSILSTAANQQIAGYTKKKLLHLDELLEVIRKQIINDDVRILTDKVTVVSCNIIPIDIHTKVTAQPEDIIETARKQFIEKFESSKKLGWNVTKSLIIANLFVGVQNIELIKPKEDILVKGNECAFTNNIIIGNVQKSVSNRIFSSTKFSIYQERKHQVER